MPELHRSVRQHQNTTCSGVEGIRIRLPSSTLYIRPNNQPTAASAMSNRPTKSWKDYRPLGYPNAPPFGQILLDPTNTEQRRAFLKAYFGWLNPRFKSSNDANSVDQVYSRLEHKHEFEVYEYIRSLPAIPTQRQFCYFIDRMIWVHFCEYLLPFLFASHELTKILNQLSTLWGMLTRTCQNGHGQTTYLQPILKRKGSRRSSSDMDITMSVSKSARCAGPV